MKIVYPSLMYITLAKIQDVILSETDTPFAKDYLHHQKPSHVFPVKTWCPSVIWHVDKGTPPCWRIHCQWQSTIRTFGWFSSISKEGYQTSYSEVINLSPHKFMLPWHAAAPVRTHSRKICCVIPLIDVFSVAFQKHIITLATSLCHALIRVCI